MATATLKNKAQTGMPESIVNNAAKLHASFEIGDVSHQGDLMLVRIERLPAQAKPRKERQLAEGNTQGSRHILRRGKVYSAEPAVIARLIKSATKCEVDARYIGPIFVSPKSPTSSDLDHPEHGPQGFPAGAVIACVYQRSLDSEEREQRVRD